jgi:pimeloyl-ACP methyl ester carboxylesterase
MRTGLDERRPPWRRLLAEGPAAVRLLAAQLRRPPVEGEGGGGSEGVPVLVLPAFLANDLPTGLLRRTLEASGFRAYGWRQGINAGARAGKFERLLRRIDIIHAETGRRLVLIGWSLGGLYARELAKRRPDKVQLVVTLGTPFGQGNLRRNNAWKLYEAVNDHDVDHPPVEVRPGEKPPVHTIACWSPRDGIVAPASAGGAEGEADERVELGCRHNELVSDPEALRTVVALLRRHAC